MIGLLGCEKEENPPFYNANSCIELSSNIAYVDSTIQFKNCSDSVNVEYKWDFGDGSTSKKRFANHIYKNTGNYTVTLTTYVNNIQTDSSSVRVRVIIGEKYFDLLKITGGLDFVECSDSSILVYGETGDEHEYKIFLSKFDKNLRNKWTKYLDTQLNPFIRSIESLSDGNFILSGSFNNSNNTGYFALSKIDSSGTVLWDYKYPQVKGICNYATETKDGGIIAIGTDDYFHSPSGNTVQLVSVIKTDADGIFEWKRQFVDDWLMDADNIISVDDGFIFASSTRGATGFLNGHDSLIIMKIGFDNQTIWKKSKEWQIPDHVVSYNVWSSSIALNNSKLVAINEGNGFVMVFDLQGNFIARNYTDIGRNSFITTTANNNFIIGGGDIFWETVNLNGFNNTGEKQWSKSYGKRNKMCFPAYGYGSKVKPLLDGNLLFLGLSYKECKDFIEGSMLLVKINENGEIQ